MKLIFCLLFIFLFLGCEDKPLTYNKEELYKLAREGDPNLKLVLPSNMNEVIPCSDYGEGCLSGHRIMAKDLEFIAIEFDTPKHAKKSAQGIRAWVSRNWLFDDVTGEPVLEVFVKETLKAEPAFSIERK